MSSCYFRHHGKTTGWTRSNPDITLRESALFNNTAI